MRIELNISGISPNDADRATGAAVAAVSEQALTDCNYYCKQDTGALIQSSLIHSDTDGGVLKWVEPYAERQYFMPSARPDKNSNASPEWCERAEADFGDVWQDIFKERFEAEL